MVIPVLNQAVENSVDQFVKETIEEAARAWLDAAMSIVPAWSGASRATFQALADAVGKNVPINRAGGAPNRIGLGRLYSSGGIRKRSFAFWDMYYESTLNYLIANETKKVQPRTEGLFGSLIEPTPYKFRAAGDAAALIVINENLKTLYYLNHVFDKGIIK